MSRLILLLIILAAVVYVIVRISKPSLEQKKRYLRFIVVTALISFLIALVATGRLSWLIAAMGALLPLIPKVIRLLFGVWPRLLPYFRRYQQNKHSNMQTDFIRLQVDIVTGELKGEVLQGRYKGQALQSMSLQQLLGLLDECKQSDNNSALMLMSFLDRVQPGWSGDRAQPNAGPGDTGSGGIELDRQQAREVLGVPATASKAEIVKAHKRIMQKLHPDRGGSDFLAQQINKAKEVLLKSL